MGNEGAEPVGVIAESVSPFGNLVATVEDDGRTVYLYLNHVERRDFGMRAVWVRNRIAAPMVDDDEARALRIAPRPPRHAVRNPEGAEALGKVELVWLEAGDGVALVAEDGDVLAMLPGGAARGFARDVVGEVPWAMELTASARDSVSRARATWARWASAAAWRDVKEPGLAFLEARLGPHAQYFAADGGRFPPLALTRHVYAQANANIYATIGMCAFPMPGAPEGQRRLEIALATEGEPSWATSTLAWLARYPWNDYVWLGDGHIVSSPTGHATWFPPDSSALLLTAAIDAPDVAGQTLADGEPVARVWAIPITMDERKIAELSGAAALVARLPAIGKTFVARL